MSRILSPATPIAPPTPIDAAGTQTKRLKSKSSFSFSRRKSPSTSSKPPFPTPSSPPLVQASSPVTAHKEFTTKSPIPSQRFDQSPRLADHPPPRQSPVVHQVESPRIHDVPPLPAKTFEEDVRAGVGSTPVVGDEAEEDERGDEMGSGYVRDEIEEDSEEEKRRKRFSLRDFQLPAHEMDSSEFGLFGGEFGTMGESDYDFASNAAFIDKPTMPLRLNTILPDSLHSVSTISVSTQSGDNLDSTSQQRTNDPSRPRDKNLLDFPTPPSTQLPPLPPVVLPRRTSSLSPSLHSVPTRSSSSSPRASTTPIRQRISPSTSNRSTPRVTREESLTRKSSPAQDLEASLRALEIAEIGLGLSASESTNSIVSTTSSMREELFYNYRAISAHLKAQENANTIHPSSAPQSQPMSLNSSQSSQPPNRYSTERHPLNASIGSHSPSLASTIDSTTSGVPPRSTSSSPTNYRSRPVPDFGARSSPQPTADGLDSPVVLSNPPPFVRPSPALDPERTSINVSPKSGPRTIRTAIVDSAPIPSPVLPSGAPIWAESFPPALTPTRTSPIVSKRSTPPSRPPPSPSLPPLPPQSKSNPTTPTLPRKKSFSLLRRRKSEVDLNSPPLPKEVEPPLPTSNGSRRSSEGGSIDGSGGSTGSGKRKSKFAMFLPRRKEKGEVPPMPNSNSRTTSPFPPTSPRFPSHSHSNSPSFIQRDQFESEPPTPTQAAFSSPTESRLMPPGRKESLSPSVASTVPPSPTSVVEESGAYGQLAKSSGSNGPPALTTGRNGTASGSTPSGNRSSVRESDTPSTLPLRLSSSSRPHSPLLTATSTAVPSVVDTSAINNDDISPPPVVLSHPPPNSDVSPEPIDHASWDQSTSATEQRKEDFESLSKEAMRAMEHRHIPPSVIRKASLVGEDGLEEVSAEGKVVYSKLPTSVSDEVAISGRLKSAVEVAMDGQYEDAGEAEDDVRGMQEIAEAKEDGSVIGPAGEGDTTLDDEADSEEDDVPLGTLPGALSMQKSLRLKNSSRSTSRNQANASKKSSLSSNSVTISTVRHSAPRRNPFEFDPTASVDTPAVIDAKLGESKRESPSLDVAQAPVGHSMLPQTDESVVRRQGVVKSPSLPLDQVISDSVLTLDHPPPSQATPSSVIVASTAPTARPPPHLIRQKSPPAPIDTAASNYARSTVESTPTLAAMYGLNRQPSGSSRPALLTRNSHDSHSQQYSSRSRAGTLSSAGTSSVPNSRRPSSAKEQPTPTNSISSHSHSVPPQPQPSPNSSTIAITPPLPTQPILSKHRVYIVDHTRSFVVSATALTRCGDIVAEARAQGSLAGNDKEAGGYALWEIWRTLGVERPTREFELLADVIKSWSHESPNILIIRKTSMLSVLASHLRPRPLEARAGWVTIEVKRGKWVKRWLELKETTLTHYKSEKLKEPIQLCQLASFDAFFVAPHTATSINSPKAFTFAIKSVLPSAHYENGDEFCHFVSVKLEDEREAWVKAIISARNGVVRTRERDVFASIATTAQGLTLPTTQQSIPNTTTTQSYRQAPHSNGLANPAAASRSKSVSHRPPPTLLQQHPQLSASMVPALSLDSRLHPPTAGSGIPTNGAAVGGSSRPNAAAWAGMSLHDRQQWLKGAQADARENGHTFLQF